MVCLFRNRHLQIDWAIITDISSGFKRKNLLLPKTTKIYIFKGSTADAIVWCCPKKTRGDKLPGDPLWPYRVRL